MSEEPPRPSFQMSVEARLLRQHLATLKPGESVTYDQLAAIAGLPSVEGSTPALTTARRVLQRETGAVIGCLNGAGVTRLTDEEIVGAADKAVASIRRKSRRTIAKLSVVEFDALPNPSKLRHSALTSLFNLVQWFGREKQVVTLERAIPEGQRRLQIGDALSVFRKK